MKKVLNLYAGVGGNRMLWDGVEVTAVEFNPSIAAVYKDLYPNDEVVVGDAHEFLRLNHRDFDFIWASPPCQSHSKVRKIGLEKKDGSLAYDELFPDMKLWQEILFLQHHSKTDWVVENVVPYYKPLIQPSMFIGNHYYWSNKFFLDCGVDKFRNHNGSVDSLQSHKKIDLSKYRFEGITKEQVLRNMVEPDAGLYIFDSITKQKEAA